MDKYKAYCTVHGWQEVISQGEPTVCPVDNQPELKPNSATILQLGVRVNDGTATELSLDNYKTLRYNEIDAKSGQLIDAGFTYAGKTFSLSQNAQINLLALEVDKNSMQYPIEWNTIDDADKYYIVDATDATNFHLTSLNVVKTILDSGTALKDQIRAAVDKAQVDAVIDNR
jgi:hypothetical protein